jgi:hypothetical protein
MGNELITFGCVHCRQLLDIEPEYAGEIVKCCICDELTYVPQRQTYREDDPSVNLSIGMQGAPEFKSEVSRSDAGKLAFTFLGGAVAIAAMIFGINVSKRG